MPISNGTSNTLEITIKTSYLTHKLFNVPRSLCKTALTLSTIILNLEYLINLLKEFEWPLYKNSSFKNKV